MIHQRSLVPKTDNELSKPTYGDGQNTCNNFKKMDAKKAYCTLGNNLKTYFVLICSTMFLKMSSVECLSTTTPTPSTTTPTPSTGEYFTSILRMTELALLEQSVVAEMYKVVQTGELRQEEISKMKSYLFDYETSIQPMLFETDVQTVVASHPLIAYRTLRRITFSLPDIVQYNVDGRLENLAKLAALIRPAVTADDVIGAMEGILRLQATYLISSLDFASGTLHNFETKSGLTEMDCFLIGNMALNDMKQPLTAIEWFVQALRMLLRMDVDDSSGMILMQIVRFGLRNAIEMYNKEMNKNPLTFFKAIETKISEMTKDNESELMKTFSINSALQQHHLLLESEDEINFRALCRGEKIRNETVRKNLKCYHKTDNPFLVIKPLKVEILSYDPLVLQFYDLLPETIINHFINSTSHLLERALVATDFIGSKALSKGRIACTHWYDDRSDERLKAVTQIIHEATSLNLIPSDSTESSQISTYGAIGGHFGPHYDNIQNNQLYDDKTYDDATISRGDRIATIMFYLSDLKLGGGTAFPKIGVLAEPIKGSAVFWYNLKKNGQRNEQTMHGGCPVLLGEKWVVNKWIRGGDQMFIRKCSLDSNM